jgi:uncharacterized OB-fold protein
MRAARTAAKQLGGGEPHGAGYAGAADVGLGLAAVLDVAEPQKTILLVSAVDGCDAIVLRTTARLPGARAGQSLAAQLAAAPDVAYPTYLSWRGLLEREPPRRPEPDRPAGPPSARSEAWKFAFVGSRCQECGRVHVPPQRVCDNCRAVDRMEREPLAAKQATVATYTVDRLAYSPSPPVIGVVIDFDGGGRFTCQLTDAPDASVAIGDRVDMTFRRLYTSEGVHNYFWKARPALDGAVARRED